MDQITFSKAIEGYLLHARARRLSEHTIKDYLNTFRKLSAYLGGDPLVSSITSVHVREFLSSQTSVSNKTLLNYHTGLSAFWTWAVHERLADTHIVQHITRPIPEEREIEPLTLIEVKAILSSLDKSKSYTRPGKCECQHSLGNATRNRAIILILLDTGIRADELCQLRIIDVNLTNRHLMIMGKGKKERQIPFSAQTGQSIWRYLSTRQDTRVNEPLLITRTGRPIARDELCHLIANIGDRAGVAGAHPHRFRHTFAITFLRNGGDIFTLQRILGHSSLDMVRRYLAIAQTDIEAAHRFASPVANWRL